VRTVGTFRTPEQASAAFEWMRKHLRAARRSGARAANADAVFEAAKAQALESSGGFVPKERDLPQEVARWIAARRVQDERQEKARQIAAKTVQAKEVEADNANETNVAGTGKNSIDGAGSTSTAIATTMRSSIGRDDGGSTSADTARTGGSQKQDETLEEKQEKARQPGRSLPRGSRPRSRRRPGGSLPR